MNKITTQNFAFVSETDGESAILIRSSFIDGTPWFVAKDVLTALELDRKALERIDEDEKGVNSIHTLGGSQEMTVVNESGLYSLIMGSRKKSAKRFRKWVTSEVLPAIRRTGSYTAPNAAETAAATDRVQKLEENVTQMAHVIVEATKTLSTLHTKIKNLEAQAIPDEIHRPALPLLKLYLEKNYPGRCPSGHWFEISRNLRTTTTATQYAINQHNNAF